MDDTTCQKCGQPVDRYCWSVNAGRVPLPDGGWRDMSVGDMWFRDDPFVKAHPGFFSETPITVQSSIGRQNEPATPLETRRRVRLRG